MNNDQDYYKDDGMNYTQAPDNGGGYGGGSDYNYNNQNNHNNGKGQESGFGIASLILGIISIPVTCCAIFFFPVSFVFAVLSIIFGIIQIVRNEKKVMAIIGIVCSTLAVILTIIFVMMGAFIINAFDLNGDKRIDMQELERFSESDFYDDYSNDDF